MSVKKICRGKGKLAVAGAAYISGSKLTNEYDGFTHDYTQKFGVMHTEIMLPSHAPPEYKDRHTLWNAIEKIEKSVDAQLARSFDIALPKELSYSENISLVREYIQTNFIRCGMCADFAIHDQHNGNDNVHAHIQLTTRKIKPNGEWDSKERKAYALDENGERIPLIDPATGSQKVDGNNRKQWRRVKTLVNDRNERDNMELWRKSWADICNKYLEDYHIQIGHRSYARQSIAKIPSVHLGKTTRCITTSTSG